MTMSAAAADILRCINHQRKKTSLPTITSACILFLGLCNSIQLAATATAATNHNQRRCNPSPASSAMLMASSSSSGSGISHQRRDLSSRTAQLLFVTPIVRSMNRKKISSLPTSSSSSSSSTTTNIRLARNRNSNYDGDDDDDDDVDWRDEYYDDNKEDDSYYNKPPPPRRRRRQQRPSIDNLGTPPLTGSSPDDTSLSIPSPFGRGDTGLRLPSSVSAALLAGVFVLGMGTGVTVDSQINTNPRDLASRDAVDKNAPNPTLCTTYGASAMAFDQRVFVSFNPFNVYVAQADVKPACVLRPANIVPVLKERKLLNDDEIRSCKMNMNTWAFVGDLNDQPQLSCVYKSEDAQNEFLDDPKRGIGEDYLDDDVKKMMMQTNSGTTRKMVKDTLTEGQKKMVMDMGGGGGAR